MPLPCFWMGVFALIQLVFIISISTQFLFKKIAWCRQRLRTTASEGSSWWCLSSSNNRCTVILPTISGSK
uniref:Uncharacterized protein n=1 Tax=Arundo donax TaxID=35708 RepID=A0A0A9HLE9_ARUDO